MFLRDTSAESWEGPPPTDEEQVVKIILRALDTCAGRLVDGRLEATL